MSNNIPGNFGLNSNFNLSRLVELDNQPTGLNGGNLTQPYVLPTADLANSQSFINAIMIQATNLLDNLELNGLLANRMLSKACSLDKAKQEDNSGNAIMSAAEIQLASACVSSGLQIGASCVSLGDTLGSADDQAKSIQMKADMAAGKPIMGPDGVTPLSATDATKQANLLDVAAKRLDGYATNVNQIYGQAIPQAVNATGGMGAAFFNAAKEQYQASGDRDQAYATQASANADDYTTHKKKLDDNRKSIAEFIHQMQLSVFEEMKATTTA